MGLVTCPDCGNQVSEAAAACPQCGRPQAIPVPQRADPGQDAMMRALLPIGRSGWAIAAGYLGLIAILMWPAPFAIATGTIAVIDIRRHPEKHGMGRAIFGIVMGLLSIAILLAMMLLR